MFDSPREGAYAKGVMNLIQRWTVYVFVFLGILKPVGVSIEVSPE